MDPSADPQHHLAQMDFFHKLGYSTAQVQAIQQQFGPNTDTDKVLGELVRIGAGQEAKQEPVTTVSVLVPRGNHQNSSPTVQLPLPSSAAGGEDKHGEDDVLRPIVLDGSNVAMSHGNKEVFSCLGIQLAVNFFLERGHTHITVFVPSWRKEQPRPDVPITDQHILRDLERKKFLVFTPSRRVAGKRVVCNDDWFIVKLAYESDGIIVSNDMYRDLQGKEPEWKRFIEERLLMYSFVSDKFMPPDDPLGRYGPTLENFLRKFPKTQKKPLCPYGKKCTYGTKCKYHHPERASKSSHSSSVELRDQAKQPWTSQRPPSAPSTPVLGQSLSLVEDMAKKLTLGPESGFSKTLKDHKHEYVSQKASQCPSKRATCRKEKSSQHSPSDHSLQDSGSQEQLDSGLGSIDSQLMEGPWSDHFYGVKHSGSQHSQLYSPPRNAPYRCCSHSPFSEGNASASYHQQYNGGYVSRPRSDVTAYGPSHYTSYASYPVSMPTYIDRHWSEPYGSNPWVVQNRPAEHFHWGPPQVEQQTPSGLKEREAVRKKLLAIFSAHLVDAAMTRFPELMDPELLVAEILKLQSESRSLR